MEKKRFSVSNRDVLDPENFRFSSTHWKIWAGTRHATSVAGEEFIDQGDVNYGLEAVIVELTDFSTYYRMYVHGASPVGTRNTWIKSLTSTDTTN